MEGELVRFVIASVVTTWALGFTLGQFCNIERIMYRYVLSTILLCIFINRYFNVLLRLSVVDFPAVHIRLLSDEPSRASLLELLFEYLSSVTPLWVINFFGDALAVVALFYLVSKINELYQAMCLATWKDYWNYAGGVIITTVKKIPIISGFVHKEFSVIEDQIKKMLKGSSTYERILSLPPTGKSDNDLLSEMRAMATTEDAKWQDGFVSGAVYSGEPAHLDVLNEAYALYSVSNPLHADIWPSVMKFEAEIISMTANLVNGGNSDVCGVMSSGGTESIFLATKSHLKWFESEFGVTKPEIIAGVTAHAAIDKACDILGIKLIKVPVDPLTFKVDVKAVQRNISARTIMLYASAPNFPQGIIDDISELSALAKTYNVGLHVDCCLGGFFLPFARKLGYDLPKFDFELPGVTSMSCDTHKYGYSSKGTSVVLYRNKSIRRYQYFVFPEWTGGLYITPTIAGSRPGALSAACWASMIRLGEEGYLSRTKDIMEVVEEIRKGIDAISGVDVLGDPKAMVVSFGSKKCNIFRIGDIMSSRGWNLNSLQFPPCIHICVTLRHVGKAKAFLQDLQDASETVLSDPTAKHDENASSGIYGLAAAMPAGPVEDILRTYTDITLEA